MVSKLDAKKVQLGKLDAQVKVILKRVTCLSHLQSKVQERAQVLEGVEQKIETSQQILRYHF